MLGARRPEAGDVAEAELPEERQLGVAEEEVLLERQLGVDEVELREEQRYPLLSNNSSRW